jgi:thiamine-phosphate pyrophosphorylase
MVQYRCKSGNDRERLDEAKALRMLCRNHGALFVINDRIDLALAVDADGVHLGQDDLPTDVARGLIGEARLLGRSTHTLDDVRRADAEACDYLGLGPVHTTAVKPDKPADWPDAFARGPGHSRVCRCSPLEALISTTSRHSSMWAAGASL